MAATMSQKYEQVRVSTDPSFSRVTKCFRSLPVPFVFIGPRKVVMRRRPESQPYRCSRQLTLGADSLVHPRGDYNEQLLLSSNGIDVERLGLHGRYFIEGLGPKVPITLLPANTTMPTGLCLVHKQSRIYCIETDRVCTLKDFNKKLKLLHDSLVEMTQAEFIEQNHQYWETLVERANSRNEGRILVYGGR